MGLNWTFPLPMPGISTEMETSLWLLLSELLVPLAPHMKNIADFLKVVPTLRLSLLRPRSRIMLPSPPHKSSCRLLGSKPPRYFVVFNCQPPGLRRISNSDFAVPLRQEINSFWYELVFLFHRTGSNSALQLVDYFRITKTCNSSRYRNS